MKTNQDFEYEASAAGRVNIIGEHVDYCGGKVFPAALSLKNTIRIRKNGTNEIRLSFTDIPNVFHLPIDRLSEYKTVKFASYFAACALALQDAGISLVGCDVLSDCTVPFGSGLSSSAAIEVSFIAAILALVGAEKSKVEIALLAQKAEREYVGTQCGIMDQYASACGKKDHAMLLSCDDLSCEYVPLTLGDYALVIANTNKPHSLSDGKYNERREETERALKQLQTRLSAPCLAAVTEDAIKENRDVLPGVLYSRALHVATEVKRVEKAAEAMKKGDLESLGRLLKESHASLRDLFEVTGAELDALADAANEFPYCLGSRMTGGGFGGSTVSIVRKDKISEFEAFVSERYERATHYKPDFYTAEIADGITLRKIKG